MVMNTKNYVLDFDSQIDQKQKLDKLVSISYLKNKKFFGENIPSIKITFLYTRPQMYKVCDQKTPGWLVGYTKNKQIFIFSPSIFSQVSDHPDSDFPYVLTHELAHIFSNELLGFYYPLWLHEGLAGYIACQYKIRKVKNTDQFSKLHDAKSWNQHPNYPQSFNFTKYLVNHFGKQKITQFLKQLPKAVGKHHYPSEFEKFFQQFFKTEFNNIAQNWLNTHKK